MLKNVNAIYYSVLENKIGEKPSASPKYKLCYLNLVGKEKEFETLGEVADEVFQKLFLKKSDESFNFDSVTLFRCASKDGDNYEGKPHIRATREKVDVIGAPAVNDELYCLGESAFRLIEKSVLELKADSVKKSD